MLRFFGDGERDFALTSKTIPELERTTGAGIGTLFTRLSQGGYRLVEIVETIRLGMIGGGTSAEEAAALVRAYVATEGNPLIEAQILALDILTRLYVGDQKETAQ